MLPNLAQRFSSINPPSGGKFHLHPVIQSLISFPLSGAASDPALFKLDRSPGPISQVRIGPARSNITWTLGIWEPVLRVSLVYCCGINYDQKTDSIAALNPDRQSWTLSQSQPIPRRHGDRKISDLTAP